MADAPDLPFLLHKFKEYNPNQDTTLIEKAYHFAEKAHEGQKRETRISGIKIRLENNVFKANTGSTAFPLSDFFLNTS